MRRYYQILGVSPNATSEEIKAAWRFSTKAFHPDKFAGSSSEQQRVAHERTQAINEAYSVLSDPLKRAAYDREYKRGASGEGAPPRSDPAPPPRPAPPPTGTPRSLATVLRWVVAIALAATLGWALFGRQHSQPDEQTEVGSHAAIKARADAGEADAQYRLGISYAEGSGVKKNEVEAVKWFRKAAEQNHGEAQFILGVRYTLGDGVPEDQVETSKWFRKAAEQNDPQAQFALAFRYTHGKGVPEDQIEAVKWYRRAAAQNHPLAQYNLGLRYIDGNGAEKDQVEGYKWILLALRQGFEQTRERMTEVTNTMTREQIAEGEKRADAFNPR